jgi:HTH-type transcriptional regulator / antitoxin HigA
MMIRPIRSDRDHAEAVARIEAIFAAKPGTREFDELDPPSPIDAIKFRMEQGACSRADLAKLLGSSAKVTEVLHHKRALSKAMIVRLHRSLEIPYEVLLGDVERVRAPKKSRSSAKNKTKLRAAG